MMRTSGLLNLVRQSEKEVAKISRKRFLEIFTAAIEPSVPGDFETSLNLKRNPAMINLCNSAILNP